MKILRNSKMSWFLIMAKWLYELHDQNKSMPLWHNGSGRDLSWLLKIYYLQQVDLALFFSLFCFNFYIKISKKSNETHTLDQKSEYLPEIKSWNKLSECKKSYVHRRWIYLSSFYVENQSFVRRFIFVLANFSS